VKTLRKIQILWVWGRKP